MKNLSRYVISIVLASCAAAPVLAHEALSDDYGEKLGTVNFPVSCNAEAGDLAGRGLALLHHMTYVGARAQLAAAAKADPDCAMAYWGQAMTLIHPLWADWLSEEQFAQGQEWLETAQTRGDKSAREQAYIDALKAYFEPGWDRNDAANLTSFSQAWEKVYREFPQDHEAAAFYALALQATADRQDKTYAKQKQAGKIAEKILDEVPDHPGAHHYLIHAYDYPALAAQAEAVAREYGELATNVPHPLHMPTHIFTRLGLWPESIELNKRSAAAALKHPAGDRISLHYPHALDYLSYAYLQQGDDVQARAVLDKLHAIDESIQERMGTAYSLAAVPARFVLERQQWHDAAALEPGVPADYPWARFPAMQAMTYFARALGAAHSGNEQAARQAIDKLAQLRDETAEDSAYWAQQVEVQRLSAQAWLDYLQGHKDQGLNTMREATGLEASTDKHPVTPGEVLPAHELLGDMLLDMGRYDEAYSAYQDSLQRNANRFHSLYGAGRTAELAGDEGNARRYYEKLIGMTVADSGRGELQQARAFLDGAIVQNN